MLTNEQEQARLERHLAEPVPTFFNMNFPIWRCPCGKLERYADTFGEWCFHCNTNHTLDWQTFIVHPLVKEYWLPLEVG